MPVCKHYLVKPCNASMKWVNIIGPRENNGEIEALWSVFPKNTQQINTVTRSFGLQAPSSTQQQYLVHLKFTALGHLTSPCPIFSLFRRSTLTFNLLHSHADSKLVTSTSVMTLEMLLTNVLAPQSIKELYVQEPPPASAKEARPQIFLQLKRSLYLQSFQTALTNTREQMGEDGSERTWT